VSPYGKRVTLACGHEGEAVVGQFFVCLAKCNGIVPRKTTCPKCYSKNTREFEAVNVPAGSMSCWQCGAVFWEP
jgi:hypothetical protein